MKRRIWTDEELKPYVHSTAVAWATATDREFDNGQVIYFVNNWRALPGLRKRVVERAEAERMSEDKILLTYEAVLEACALLVLDETATPVSVVDRDGDGEFEVTAKEAVVNARFTLAAQIRAMTADEAREVLYANCFQKDPAP